MNKTKERREKLQCRQKDLSDDEEVKKMVIDEGLSCK